MSERDNGGPAFSAAHFYLADNEHGMTLRDYFAAKALDGLVSEPYHQDVDATVRLLTKKGSADGEELALRFAEAAYMMADAMLKERAK